MTNRSSIRKTPPEWLYPLYKKIDRKMFDVIGRITRNRKKIIVKGSPGDVDNFVKLLIVSTKLKKWRTFIIQVIQGFKNGVIDLPQLVRQGKGFKIKKGIDRSWAVYTQDERLCLAIDKLASRRVHYIGTNNELIEFICRFLLTELLQDWRGPKMMVVKESIKGNSVRLNRLNSLLALWDFTEIFK